MVYLFFRETTYIGDSLNTLAGNMARVADYIKILKAEMDAYPQIKETSFGQKIKNMLSKGGDWLEDITKGISAIITEWRGIKKEEDKKIEQRAGQPAGNSFTPTPFDWRNYTNSETARTNDKITNMPSPAEQRNLSEVHKSVQEIEKKFGVHIKINSAFRNEELNNTVGGVSNSSHRIGYAADIEIEKEKHADVMRWLRDHMTDESRKDRGLPTINQAISYPGSNFIHIDINPAGGARKNPGRQFMVEVNKTKYMYKFK